MLNMLLLDKFSSQSNATRPRHLDWDFVDTYFMESPLHKVIQPPTLGLHPRPDRPLEQPPNAEPRLRAVQRRYSIVRG